MKRPGPEIGIRGGQLMRVLQRLQPPKDVEAHETAEKMIARMESLTDDDFTRLMVFARQVVMAALVIPKLVAMPSPGVENEIGPDDIPFPDFFFIFMWATSGSTGIPVATKDGETTVEAVETFPGTEGPGPGAGGDGGAKPLPTVNPGGNNRSDDSASV